MKKLIISWLIVAGVILWLFYDKGIDYGEPDRYEQFTNME